MKWKLLLVAALGYIVLGCYLTSTTFNSSVNKRRPVVLVLAVPPGVTTDPIYKKTVERFEKDHPNIGVTLLPLSGSGNFYQKLMVMIVGRTAPDLMWMGQSFNEFADRGAFLDLTDRIKEWGIDLKEYNSEALSWYNKKGRLYSLPFGLDVSFLLYNRKLFREAGLPDPKDDWKLPEFLNTAKLLTKRDADGNAICYGFRGKLEYGVFGASPLDKKTGEVTCDSPEMLEFFKTNLDLSRKWHISPPPEEVKVIDSRSLGYFKQERTAIMWLTTVTLPAVSQVFKGMDFGFVLQPAVKQHSQWASGQAICIYSKTKYPKEAFELFKYFQDAEFQLPMSHRMVPARRSIAELKFKDTSGKPYNYRAMLKATEMMEPIARIPHLQELMAVYRRFYGKIMAGRLSPEEGMRQASNEMNRRIEKFKKDDAGYKEL